METITLPVQFLEVMGNLTIEVQILVLRFMPFLIVFLFTWGFISFLLGASGGKLDFKKYLFTPLFLYVLAVNYPTAIDITGKFYGMIINTFDKPEYKNFHLTYTGMQEELQVYKDEADKQLENYKTILEKKQGVAKVQEETATKLNDEAKKEAAQLAKKEINAKLAYANQIADGKATSALASIWDFFSLPTVRIVRYIIDLVRNCSLCFLVVVGCLAVFFECIPTFKGILNKWFKFYTAVTFWALTVCVLDATFLAFAEAGVASAKSFMESAQVVESAKMTLINSYTHYYTPGTFTSYDLSATDFALKWYGYGGSKGINTAVSVVLVLFYCMVPFLTSLYIGGEQAGMFMSKVVGVGSMATQQILSTTTNVGTSAGRAIGGTVGGSGGAAAGAGIGNIAGMAAGAVGVKSAGS